MPLRATTSERPCSRQPIGRLPRTTCPLRLAPGFSSAVGVPNGVLDWVYPRLAPNTPVTVSTNPIKTVRSLRAPCSTLVPTANAAGCIVLLFMVKCSCELKALAIATESALDGLPTQCLAIFSVVGCGAVDAINGHFNVGDWTGTGLHRRRQTGITLEEDGLQPSDGAICSTDGMAQGLERRPDESPQVRLEVQGTRASGALVMGVARRVGRCLWVETQIDHVHQMRDMRVSLNRSLHVAHRQQRLAVLHDEAGDDGVERPFARRDPVGMRLIPGESRAAVMQHEAIARHRNPAAIHVEHAVHDRSHIAPAIRRHEVDGAALQIARHPGYAGLVHVDL